MPNAIPELLDPHPAIRAVAFNGSTARRLYDRHFARRPDLTYLALPSTSPAHARLGFAEKLAQWSVARGAAVADQPQYPGQFNSASGRAGRIGFL